MSPHGNNSVDEGNYTNQGEINIDEMDINELVVDDAEYDINTHRQHILIQALEDEDEERALNIFNIPPPGMPQGIPLGTPQGAPHSTTTGMPLGIPQGTPQEAPTSTNRGIPQGTPHGTPQGVTTNIPTGTRQGTIQGITQGMRQGTSVGTIHGMAGIISTGDNTC